MCELKSRSPQECATCVATSTSRCSCHARAGALQAGCAAHVVHASARRLKHARARVCSRRPRGATGRRLHNIQRSTWSAAQHTHPRPVLTHAACAATAAATHGTTDSQRQAPSAHAHCAAAATGGRTTACMCTRSRACGGAASEWRTHVTEKQFLVTCMSTRARTHLWAVRVPSRQCGAGPGSWVAEKLRMRSTWQTVLVMCVCVEGGFVGGCAGGGGGGGGGERVCATIVHAPTTTL
jgi:hypothetical protein